MCFLPSSSIMDVRLQYKCKTLPLHLGDPMTLETVKEAASQAFGLPKTWVQGSWCLEVEVNGAWKELTSLEEVRGAANLRITEILNAGSDIPLGDPLTVEALSEEERKLAPYILRGKVARKAVDLGKDCYKDPASGEIIKTSVYLEKRPCCGEKCRHCPYNYVNVPKEDSSSDEDEEDEDENEADADAADASKNDSCVARMPLCCFSCIFVVLRWA